MALSQTSLDIDDLTVVTLFDRGSHLSTFEQYMPVASNINGFSKWVTETITDAFGKTLYATKNSPFIISTLLYESSLDVYTSSSLYYNIYTISTFSNINNSTIVLLSNIDKSTINSYFNSLIENTSTAGNTNATISRLYPRIVPGVSTTVSSFYDTLFSPTASTFISTGYYLYVPPPNPQRASGNAPRYIGPGLSTLYSNSINRNLPFYDNISSNFTNILSSSESAWILSNASVNPYRNTFKNTALGTSNYIDTGSSLSTVFEKSISTFQSSLTTAYNYGLYVSSSSTFVTSSINAVNVPTIRGDSMSTIVNKSFSSMMNNISTYTSQLNSSMTSNVLLVPLFIFSSTRITQAVSSFTGFKNLDALPGLYLLQSSFQSTLVPFYSTIELSSIYLGYQYISSYETAVFSTFSTSFPFILASKSLSTLNYTNQLVSSFSTTQVLNTSTLYRNNDKYITAPGLSSISASLSTNTTVSFNDYSKIVSSILLTFSNGLINVNSAPGISSIYLISQTLDSNIILNVNDIKSILPLYSTNNGSNNEIFSQLSTVISDITGIYISAGLLAFSTASTTFANISGIALYNINYVSSLISPPDINKNSGSLYSNLNYLSTLSPTLSNVINPYLGSTIYYPMLPLISDYSTSRSVNGSNFLLRSTSFYSVYTNTFFGQVSSLNISGPLNVGSINSNYNLNIAGSATIMPYSGQEVNPSIKLQGLDIYAQDNTIILGKNHTMSARFSTINFNEGQLTISRVYNSLIYGQVGINIDDPEYAIDIGIGNARKPKGTTWINPSDSRIKQCISDVDFSFVEEQICNLRLVSHRWSEEYRAIRTLDDNPTIGFLSQEVQKIFPKSITEMDEFGYCDFKSLDIDQLYKAKFKVTQGLLYRLSSLQMRLDRLSKES
jgi:hypothetical protein